MLATKDTIAANKMYIGRPCGFVAFGVKLVTFGASVGSVVGASVGSVGSANKSIKET